METSQDLRRRTRDEKDATADPSKGSRDRRLAMAKQGLRSLSVAVAVPLALTLANIYFFGTSDAHHTASAIKRSNWLPPLWALHATCLASSLLMAVSAWLFWAEGGLRRAPNAAGVYVAQLALSLAWDPLVFRMGANWAGLVVAGAMFGLVWKCGSMFREVNTVAGDLVKPCLAWAGFLAFVNLKLILAPGLDGSTGSA